MTCPDGGAGEGEIIFSDLFDSLPDTFFGLKENNVR